MLTLSKRERTSMRFYWPIAKVDAERRMVWGYASTEAADEQGETVTRGALAAALDDYMRFANIREMHQPSAIGVAQEAELDDKGLYLGAKIVDGDAWAKITEGVYKGFSIGGRVTARDPADRTVITGLSLTEISVVDRPANPEAVFDCWKRAAPPGTADGASRIIAEAGVRDHSLPCPACGAAAAGRDQITLHKVGEDNLAALVAGLANLANELVPRLEALQKRVDDIARTPLPPQTAGRGLTGLSKRQDTGAMLVGPDDIVAALARMSDEERTLTLIKAAHANPISPIARR
jgi:HK97 family phage prohead protease